MQPTAIRSATTTAIPSTEDVRFFVDQGYLVAPDLVSPAEIEGLKRDTADLARGKYPCPSIEPMPAGMSDAEVLERLLCIHQPHYISPVVRRFVTHPGIAGVLSRIIGAHLAHWDGAVKCMQSMLFVKPPGKPGQAWHQDEMYIPTRDRSLCGAWIAVDDATIENGCLWIIPGSHRSGYLYPSRPPADLEEFDGSNECQGFDASVAVPVEVKAGTVVFFNGYTLHRSLRNRSASCYRRALVNHYMNAWSLLPWGEEGAKPSVAMGDCRRVLQVAGADPYAWKGCALGTDVWLRQFNKAWQRDLATA